MGLKCKISYNEEGIARVMGDNGKSSQLYAELLDFLGDQERALNAWAAAYSKEFGEQGENADIGELVAFLNVTASTDEVLSPSEIFQVKDFMARNGIKSLDELYSTLASIFKPDSIFDIDIPAAIQSGLFTEEEIRGLNPDAIDAIMVKISGHLVNDNFTVSPHDQTEMYKNSDSKTIFGTYEKVTREDIDNAILDAVDNFTDIEDFYNKIKDLPYPDFVQRFLEEDEFANTIINKFIGLKKVPTLHIVGDNLTDDNLKFYTVVKNTVVSGADTLGIEADIEYLDEIDPDIWRGNPDLIQQVLKEVEAAFAEINIDVVGISERLDRRGDIMDLLDAARDLAKAQTNENLNRFVALHERILPTEQKSVADRYPEKYAPLNLVKVYSNKSQNELFSKFGLIKVGDNLYHKVNQNASLDDIKEYIFEEVKAGRIQMDITSSFDNKPAVLEEISNNLMRRKTEAPINDKELYSAYQVAFNHDPLPNKSQEVLLLSDISTDETYLKTKFISDFYGYVLQEKAKGSDLYKKVLSKIDFNDSDISLAGPIDSLEDIEYREELYDYIRLKKDSNMKYLLPPSTKTLTEDVLYTNFPDRKSEYEGDVIIDGDYIITDPTADEFIKLNGFMYRKVMEKQNSNLFARVPQVQDNNYYTTNTDFTINTLQAKEIFDKYGELSPRSVDHTKFKNTIAKSRINDNMRPDLQELSTLKDKSYTFFEVNNSIVAYKDGVRVGSIRPGRVNQNVYSDLEVSVSESHRGRGIGTELYLHMFDKISKEDITLYPSAIRTKQAQNIYSRMEDMLEMQPDGSVKVKPQETEGATWQQVADLEISQKELNNLRTSIRNRDKDSYTAEILDEVSKAMKGEDFNLPFELDFLADGITYNDVANLLMQDEIFETRTEIRNFISNRIIPISTSTAFQEVVVESETSRIKQEAIANGTFMKAPNGKQTNLSEKQWLQVRTQSFKNWFGDWVNDPENASKVIDENGEPLVVYHGSPMGNIESFKMNADKVASYGLKEFGIYFTTNRNIANVYRRKKLSPEAERENDAAIARLKEKQNQVRNNREFEELEEEIERLKGKRIYEVFLNIRDIFEFDGKEQDGLRAYDNLQVDAGYKIAKNRDAMQMLMTGWEHAKDSKPGEVAVVPKVNGILGRNVIELTEDYVADLKRRIEKYPGEALGIIARKELEEVLGDTYLLFPDDNGNFSNIKSANENIGQFSSQDPRIRYQEGELNRLRVQPAQAVEAIVERLEMTGLAEAKVITNKAQFTQGLREANKANKSMATADDVFGFTLDNKVYLNKGKFNFNTPIHEFGHLWFNWAKNNRFDLYERGMKLIEGSEYLKQIEEQAKNPKSVYHRMSPEKLREEALVTAIGNKGEDFINKKAKEGFLGWLQDLWTAIAEAVGISQVSADQLQDYTLDEFAQAVAIDLLKGETFQTTQYTIQPLMDEMLANKEGKMVSVQTINQILKQKGTKKIEKDIINEVLELDAFKGKSKIPFDLFRAEVNMRVMPLEVIESTTYSSYGLSNTGLTQERTKSRTNLYNTTLDHGITGHFASDYSNKKAKPTEMVVRQIPGTDQFAVVRLGVQLTEDNIQDNVFHVATSIEQAEQWIEDYKNSLPINNKGLFGHTRVWTQGEDVYVAEIQSDSFQKAKADDMLLTDYENNPDRMTEKQKEIFKELREKRNFLKDVNSQKSVGGNPEYGSPYANIADLSEDIAQTMSEIKRLERDVRELEESEMPINAGINARKLKEAKTLLDGYMKLAKGEEITLPEPLGNSEREKWILPYQTITSRITRAYLKGKSGKSIDLVALISSLNFEFNIIDDNKSLRDVRSDLIENGVESDTIKRFVKAFSEQDVQKYLYKSPQDLIRIRRKLAEEQNKVKNNRDFDLLQNEIDVINILLKQKNLEEVVEVYNALTNTEVKGDYTIEPGKEYTFGVQVGETFDSLEEAFDSYKKDVLPEIKVNPEYYEKYFKANRDIGKLHAQLMEEASIKDKQFIAHRKNYTDRLLREEIKRNAQQGKKTLSIPTPRTLALIEGYIEAEGRQPYEVLESDRLSDDGDLSSGDTIDYLGEEYLVISANQYDIEVIKESEGNVIDGVEYLQELRDNMIEDDMYRYDSEVGEKEKFTEEEWKEVVENADLYSIDNIDAEYFSRAQEMNDEGGIVYTIDRNLVKEKVESYHESFYEDVEGNLNDIYSEVYKMDDDKYFVTERVVFPEALKQPDQYQSLDIEDFDIDDMSSTEQTILRKYEELVDKFKNSRLDSSVYTDPEGNEWIRTNLTEEDGSKPVVAFQEVQQETKTPDQNIENISSIFDSQLELLDLYSPKEEVSIKRDIDSCGG